MSFQYNVHKKIYNELIFLTKLFKNYVIFFDERQSAIDFE